MLHTAAHIASTRTPSMQHPVCRPRHLIGLCLSILVGSLLSSQAGAQSIPLRTCQNMSYTAVQPWTINSSGTSFKNGEVLASLQTKVEIGLSTGSGAFRALFIGPGGGPYTTSALTSPTGVGLRIRAYAATFSPTPGPGSDIRPSVYYGQSLTDSAVPKQTAAILFKPEVWPFTTQQNYLIELVIVDEKAYQGGNSQITVSAPTYLQFVMTPDIDSSSGNNCGTQDFGQLLNGPLALPKPLPTPKPPTCTFASQSSPAQPMLGLVEAGAIAANGSTRASGSAGEASFTINGTDCPASKLVYVYFTDANAPASSDTYLQAKGDLANQVGVRLYYQNDTVPITFGPPPAASNPALGTSRITYETGAGGNASLSFTAQYVRQQGVSQVTQAGNLNAAVTFTIVYP